MYCLACVPRSQEQPSGASKRLLPLPPSSPAALVSSTHPKPDGDHATHERWLFVLPLGSYQPLGFIGGLWAKYCIWKRHIHDPLLRFPDGMSASSTYIPHQLLLLKAPSKHDTTSSMVLDVGLRTFLTFDVNLRPHMSRRRRACAAPLRFIYARTRSLGKKQVRAIPLAADINLSTIFGRMSGSRHTVALSPCGAACAKNAACYGWLDPHP